MIASITHLNSFSAIKGKIQYNESKVERGLGTMLLDTTFSDSSNERLSVFKDVIQGNNHVRSNLAFEVSINLPHGENVKDSEFLKIVSEYMEELKYENTPMLVYRHSDTQHKHVHVIVSHVDWDGKKIDQYNLFRKSQKLSRKLELKYNLKPTDYNKGITDEALNSKNARKYYFQNALKKGLKDFSTKAFLNENLLKEQIDILNSNPISNDQVGILLKEKKDLVKNYLSENKLFNTLIKDELFEKVESVYNRSQDTEQFINQLKGEGVYIRKIFKKGQPIFVYGLEDVAFYINDDRLGKKFTYSNLVKGRGGADKMMGGNFTSEQQKAFAKRMVVKHIEKSKTLHDFSRALLSNNIELITYQNSGGIYGIGFKSIHVEGAETFKGSDLGISWKDLQTYFERNSAVQVNEYALTEGQSSEGFWDKEYSPPYVPLHIFHNKNVDQEDFLTIRRKNKKGIKKGLI